MKCYLNEIEIEVSNLYIILNENPFITLNPNQLKELIHYVQKRYHLHFSEKIIEVIDY